MTLKAVEEVLVVEGQRNSKNIGNLGNIENKFIGYRVSNLKTYCLYLLLNEF